MQLIIYGGAIASLAIVAFVGLALFRAGRKYLRTATDTAPYCGGCGYNLSGLVGVSKRCPECGAELGAGPVVKGDPKGRTRAVRRYRLGLVIASIGFVGALIAGDRGYRQIDWYQFRSFDNLMADLTAGIPRAWPELQRRMQKDRFSEERRRQIVQFALEQKGSVERQSGLGTWVHVFWECDRLGWIAQDVKQQLLKDAIKVTLHFPDKIRKGHNVLGRIDLQSDRWLQALGLGSVGLARVEWRIDGGNWERLLPGPSTRSWMLGIPQEGLIQELPLQKAELGRHRMEFRIQTRAFPWSWKNAFTPASPIDVEIVESLTDEIEVLPNETRAKPINLSDSSVAGRFLFVHQLGFLDDGSTSGSERTPRVLEYVVSLSTVPPMAMALEVDLLYGDQVFRGTPLVISGTTWLGVYKAEGRIRAPVKTGDRVRLRFRASEAVARSSVDIFEYWDVEWEEGPYILRNR